MLVDTTSLNCPDFAVIFYIF